jgi:1-acyl-sn-glycerol-3-phosphate acyltransferase
MSNILYTTLKNISRMCFAILFSTEYIGLENVPKEGPYILCCNHYGEFDMFLAGCRIKRVIHFMGKEELFKTKLRASFFKAIKAYPVKRGSGDIKSFKQTLKFLKQGEIVGILAEGTRIKGLDRSMVKAKPGIALFAQKSGVKILPVSVKSNQKLFSKIKVIYSKPIQLEFEKDKKYSISELSQISQKVMDDIYKVIDEN